MYELKNEAPRSASQSFQTGCVEC